MEQQTLPLNHPPDAPARKVSTQAQCPEVSPDDRVTQHYVDTISGLVEDASKNETLLALVDVMAYHLAQIIVDHGALATSHVFERLGSHISYLVELNDAAKESEEARNAGHFPH